MAITTSPAGLPRVAGPPAPAGAEHTGRVARAPGSEFSSRAAAEAYVGKVCFKQGPPALIGAELEWLTAIGERSPSAPRPELTVLADALGPYAPQSISPASPALPLPGGSRVTIEPGGQIELSSAPFGAAAELCERLRADAAHLRDLLSTRDIHPFALSADAHRPPERLLQLPRYCAMEKSFAGIGPFGALMMCNTAAAQVSVDAGTDPADISARWTALYAMGPALLAAFACSPALHGAPPGEWASQRMRAWLRLDNQRTRPPVHHWPDPITGYARWALDVPLLCVRPAPASNHPAAAAGNGHADSAARNASRSNGSRPGAASAPNGSHPGGRGASNGTNGVNGPDSAGRGAVVPSTGPAVADWSAPPGATFADWLCGALDEEIGRRPDRSDLDYHLTTLFPLVRASGHLEVRYLDAQPGDTWTTPVHVFDALLSTPEVVREATTLVTPTADLWSEAARHGLADPEIRTTATALLELAAAHAPTPTAATELAAAAARCARGISPTEGHGPEAGR
ncbi:glutamate-cysteine ligase family protein [Nocardia sp. NPDC005978]|uniref:glutamate-cysteine ligase family protein n=1 Tax=Nocardia sp. NPDC005978 TaxID=3156725 RepID=UPI0033A658C9